MRSRLCLRNKTPDAIARDAAQTVSPAATRRAPALSIGRWAAAAIGEVGVDAALAIAQAATIGVFRPVIAELFLVVSAAPAHVRRFRRIGIAAFESERSFRQTPVYAGVPASLPAFARNIIFKRAPKTKMAIVLERF